MDLEKAVELGRLIGQTEEYQALKRAREGLEGATELRASFERLEQLAEALEQRAAQGQEPDPRDGEEYNRLFGELQADVRYQRLVAAQSNFDKLMMRVHERIMDGIRRGAESRIITLG